MSGRRWWHRSGSRRAGQSGAEVFAALGLAADPALTDDEGRMALSRAARFLVPAQAVKAAPETSLRAVLGLHELQRRGGFLRPGCTADIAARYVAAGLADQDGVQVALSKLDRLGGCAIGVAVNADNRHVLASLQRDRAVHGHAHERMAAGRTDSLSGPLRVGGKLARDLVAAAQLEVQARAQVVNTV